MRQVIAPVVVCVVLLLGPSCLAGPDDLLEVTVDCDAGESLPETLIKINEHGSGRVHISGTCFGFMHVTARGQVEIIGQEGSEIIGGQPAVFADGAGWLTIHNVRIEGHHALHARGHRRFVDLFDCDLEGSTRGLWVEQGASAYLVDTRISGSTYGIVAVDAVIHAERGAIHDSYWGAALYGANLLLNGTDIVDNTIGVTVEQRSTFHANGARFSNNELDLADQTDSRIGLYNATIGAPGDESGYFLYARSNATIEIYRDDPAAEVWGRAWLEDNSYLMVEDASLHGSIDLFSFSRMRLDGSVADGVVTCASAGDAWCGSGASALTNGCSNAPATCVPKPEATAAEPTTSPFPLLPPPGLGLQQLKETGGEGPEGRAVSRSR